jgi:hypothetical protein
MQVLLTPASIVVGTREDARVITLRSWTRVVEILWINAAYMGTLAGRVEKQTHTSRQIANKRSHKPLVGACQQLLRGTDGRQHQLLTTREDQAQNRPRMYTLSGREQANLGQGFTCRTTSTRQSTPCIGALVEYSSSPITASLVEGKCNAKAAQRDELAAFWKTGGVVTSERNSSRS